MFKKTTSLAMLALSAAIALPLVPTTGHAQSLTLTSEFSFHGGGVSSAGAIPLNGNLLYFNQQLYGATYAGGSVISGSFEQVGAAPDLGSIYQYATSGASPRLPVNLYGFSGPDGARPNGGLVADAHGNLYGTTQIGGANNLGTVFKLAPPAAANGVWTLTTLHSFAGPDGATPMAGVTIGPNGNLYGTTMSGGPPPAPPTGVVYSVSTSGAGYRVVSSLYPGIGSKSNLVFDPQGNILGTTYLTDGTRTRGSLFKVAPGGAYSTVMQFGFVEIPFAISTASPIGNIVRDSAGNVYGMLETIQDTTFPNNAPVHHSGAGVYEVTAGTHQFVILALFDGQQASSGVMRDAAGNLYGTTINGGATGTGSVFSISPSGVVTTLASLSSANLAPTTGVIPDPTGKLWGTTSAGGAVACATASNVTPTGCGTLFSLSP